MRLRCLPWSLSLPVVCGEGSVVSDKRNGTLLRAQWLPNPVRVCKPLEVPIAKSGFGPVVVGQAAEDQREVFVRMRIGWDTIYVSVLVSFHPRDLVVVGGVGVQDDGQR